MIDQIIAARLSGAVPTPGAGLLPQAPTPGAWPPMGYGAHMGYGAPPPVLRNSYMIDLLFRAQAEKHNQSCIVPWSIDLTL